MNARALALCVLLFAACSFAQQATQLQYTIGQNYVYDVSGVVQNNGYVSNTQESTPGYYSFMESTMVMQPTSENSTCYMFVMNLYDTVVSVNDTNDFSASQSAVYDDSLGYDVYFIQNKQGQILEIIYDSADSEYYLNIKISVINGFQTSIIGVGETSTVDESDPVGLHSSVIVGSAGEAANSLLLLKTFNQANFIQFSDPNLAPSNVALGAQSSVAVDQTGFVTAAVVSQSVIFVDATPQASVSELKRSVGDFDNTTGFEMNLASSGNLTFVYNANSDYSETTFQAKPANPISTNMYGFSSNAVQSAMRRAHTLLDFPKTLEAAIVEDTTTVALLNKVGRHIKYNNNDAELLFPFMTEATLGDLTMRDRIFFIISVAQHEGLLLKYGIFSRDCAVRMRAVLAAVYFKNPSQGLVSVLRIAALDNSCGSSVSHIAANIVKKVTGEDAEVFSSAFPYNVTVSKEVTLGGNIAGVTLSADIFAGTNFDCTQPTFNYELFGEVSATATLFGYSQDALDASIIYGQVGANALANQLSLSVWGNMVYQQQIPTIDCQSHTYPLGHTAPGFDFQYTVWITIIPITFSAGASLTLNLEWGWDLCTTSLTASIDADADAQLTLTGSSSTDLLLLRAGFDIQGAFSIEIIPKAQVDGTLCEIDFEIDVNEDPMNADVISYYQWRDCKFLFFDCHWGKHNQQTWWQWSSPAKSFTLFQQTYKIAN